MKTKNYVLIPILLVLVVSLINKAFAQAKTKTSRQIELLVKEKKMRTDAQKKIDSQLLQAIREKQGKKMVADVDLEPANVNADKNGTVNVDISAEVTDALLSKIKSCGGIIIYPSKEYKTIRAEVNLSMIEKIAGFSEVRFIAPAALPQNNHIRPVSPLNSSVTDVPANIPHAAKRDSLKLERP